MKHKLRNLGMLVSTLVLTALPFAQVHAASAPNLYFAPANVTAPLNSNVSLPIKINANGTAINTVNVIVNFPGDKLDFVSLNKTGAYFDTSIPATPVAETNKLEFSVASLNSGPTSGDVLIGTLVLRSKASSGSAQITFTGSAAANNGTSIPVNTASGNVSFAPEGTPVSTVNISSIQVTDITMFGGVVKWHTDVPASSSVDFGATNQYGSTASTDGLATDHAVTIPAIFSPKTTVHFRITSVAADSSSQVSEDQTFITLGYSVQVTVKDTSGKPISGTKVSVSGGKPIKTNSQGVAIVPDVSPGIQQFTVDGGKPQPVMVNKPTAKDARPQEVTLTASRKPNIVLLAGSSLAAITILTIAGFILFQRAHRPPWIGSLPV